MNFTASDGIRKENFSSENPDSLVAPQQQYLIN
jgi:hypothetical protein